MTANKICAVIMSALVLMSWAQWLYVNMKNRNVNPNHKRQLQNAHLKEKDKTCLLKHKLFFL